MSAHIPIDHFRLVTAHIPDVTAEDIEMETSGNDHVVYFVQRQATFRFPRIPRRINPTRKAFLDAFAQLMWPFHILVDPPSAKLTGVLDYWPRISDPANDFKAFESYGTDFVAAVYQHYTLPRDETFESRRLFYAGHDVVAEFARAIRRGNAAQITIRQELLAAYIAGH